MKKKIDFKKLSELRVEYESIVPDDVSLMMMMVKDVCNSASNLAPLEDRISYHTLVDLGVLKD